MRRGIPDPRGLARLVRLVRAWRPGRAAQPHAAREPDGPRAPALRAGARALVSTIHNIYEGGRLRMAGLPADQRAGGPRDHHQPGRRRPLHSGAASCRPRCSRSFPTAWTPSATESVPPGTRRATAAEPRPRRPSSPGWRWDGSRPPRTIPTCCAPSPGCGEAQPAGGAAAGRARVAPGRDRGARGDARDWSGQRPVRGHPRGRAGVHDAWRTATSCPPPGRGCRWCCSRPRRRASPSSPPGSAAIRRWSGTGHRVPGAARRRRGAWARRCSVSWRCPRPSAGPWAPVATSTCAQHYGLGRVVDRYEAVYREVLRRKGAAAADAA